MVQLKCAHISETEVRINCVDSNNMVLNITMDYKWLYISRIENWVNPIWEEKWYSRMSASLFFSENSKEEYKSICNNNLNK